MDYSNTVDSQIQVFAALVSLAAVYHCSAILPSKKIQLPSWTIDGDTSRLVFFFKKGPTLIPTDGTPFYADTGEIKFIICKYSLLDALRQPEQAGTYPLPAGSVSDQDWLQPYAVDK